MLFSETSGQKVVSTDDASTVGHVGSFVIDPSAHKIVALSLKKTPGSGTMLPWTDITAFGIDAVTVAGDHLIVIEQGDFAELNDKHHEILKKRILTSAGQQVGTVRDIDFDPTDGAILSILTDDQPIDGSTLIGIGSYAVIVKA